MKVKLDQICQKYGLRVGKLRAECERAGLATDDASLYYLVLHSYSMQTMR